MALKRWDHGAEQWVARLNTLAEALPEYGFPVFGEAEKLAVLEQVCLGAHTYKQVKDRPVMAELESILPAHLAGLVGRLAPERIELANGKRARIRYETGRRRILSAQLQHLYDLEETPGIAEGRIKPRIEILAPNQRPVQVTSDLAGFWKTSYPEIKNQLKGRYPKHEWRDI